MPITVIPASDNSGMAAGLDFLARMIEMRKRKTEANEREANRQTEAGAEKLQEIMSGDPEAAANFFKDPEQVRAFVAAYPMHGPTATAIAKRYTAPEQASPKGVETPAAAQTPVPNDVMTPASRASMGVEAANAQQREESMKAGLARPRTAAESTLLAGQQATTRGLAAEATTREAGIVDTDVDRTKALNDSILVDGKSLGPGLVNQIRKDAIKRGVTFLEAAQAKGVDPSKVTFAPAYKQQMDELKSAYMTLTPGADEAEAMDFAGKMLISFPFEKARLENDQISALIEYYKSLGRAAEDRGDTKRDPNLPTPGQEMEAANKLAEVVGEVYAPYTQIKGESISGIKWRAKADGKGYEAVLVNDWVGPGKSPKETTLKKTAPEGISLADLRMLIDPLAPDALNEALKNNISPPTSPDDRAQAQQVLDYLRNKYGVSFDKVTLGTGKTGFEGRGAEGTNRFTNPEAFLGRVMADRMKTMSARFNVSMGEEGRTTPGTLSVMDERETPTPSLVSPRGAAPAASATPVGPGAAAVQVDPAVARLSGLAAAINKAADARAADATKQIEEAKKKRPQAQ